MASYLVKRKIGLVMHSARVPYSKLATAIAEAVNVEALFFCSISPYLEDDGSRDIAPVESYLTDYIASSHLSHILALLREK